MCRRRNAAALMPRAQPRIYEGAPHGLMLTHAERFNRDLMEFIGACEQSGVTAGCDARTDERGS